MTLQCSRSFTSFPIKSGELITDDKLLSLFNNFCEKDSNVCAILYNKNKILSIGCNTPNTKISLFKHQLKLPSVHAEVRCISKFISTVPNKTRKVSSANLIIVRGSKDGKKLMNSNPCKNCAEFITSMFINRFIRIKNIVYYDKKVIKKNIYDLEFTHVSKGWKNFYVKR